MDKKNEKIAIQKFDLAAGEELQIFVGKVMREVEAISLADGERNLSLHGIYQDYIITREWRSGKFFRFDLSREGEKVKLANKQEVVAEFKPVQTIQKSEDGGAGSVAYVEPPRESLWEGILG